MKSGICDVLTIILAVPYQKSKFIESHYETQSGSMKHPISITARFPAQRRLAGFTLVEILTVIAIITILMAAGAIGIGNLNAGKGVTSAVATCESLFEEARTIAVSKRCKARVMVDIDDVANDNYLRRVVIAHQKINADGSVDPNIWVLAGRGYDMPKGTYFSVEFSSLQDGAKIREATLSGAEVKSDYHGDYAFYEFNGEGIFEEAGASFVVGAGIRPKNQEPKTTRGAARDFSGFVIWRNGRTSMFRNPEQIPNLPDGDKPFNF